jgi:hypothetical protein
MKLSDIEFGTLESGWHRWGKEHFEDPLFQRMGLDLRDTVIHAQSAPSR